MKFILPYYALIGGDLLDLNEKGVSEKGAAFHRM